MKVVFSPRFLWKTESNRVAIRERFKGTQSWSRNNDGVKETTGTRGHSPSPHHAPQNCSLCKRTRAHVQPHALREHAEHSKMKVRIRCSRRQSIWIVLISACTQALSSSLFNYNCYISSHSLCLSPAPPHPSLCISVSSVTTRYINVSPILFSLSAATHLIIL